MNLSAEELINIENNILNGIKSVYLLIETSNHMHYIDGLNYIVSLDDNLVDIVIHAGNYTDDVFSLAFTGFGYYVSNHGNGFIIEDSEFNLENDYFQISTIHPFKLSTYQAIRKLRMDMIEKEILYKV